MGCWQPIAPDGDWRLAVGDYALGIGFNASEPDRSKHWCVNKTGAWPHCHTA